MIMILRLILFGAELKRHGLAQSQFSGLGMSIFRAAYTDQTMNSKNILGCVGWISLTFTTATLGASASISAKSFYAELALPTWAPPAWLFGPVWSVLYLAMGCAVCLVWISRESSSSRQAMVLFFLQLCANALWSWLFFAWHRGAIAMVDIIALWVLIIATIRAFYGIRPLAAILMIPYGLWVSFALVLNFAIWQLNPSKLG